MELTNEFTVPVPVERAWEVLTDVELIAPCLPGAQLQEIEGDEYRGVVKVKVGPITAQYKGAATFQDQDQAARRLVLKAEGRDTRGQGSAAAVITVSMQEQGGSTHVTVDTDLTIKGKVAQFGRGMLADVSAKLLNQFVECLEGKLDAPGPSPVQASAAAETPGPAPASTDAAVVPDPDEAVPRAPAAPATEQVSKPSATPTASGSTGSTTAAGSTPATAGSTPAAAGSTTATGSPEAPPTVRQVSQPEAKPVDLMDAAGGSVAKRVAPVAIVVLVLWLLGRHRSNKGA